MPLLNDVHSRLNSTAVRRVITPRSIDEVQGAVREAREQGAPLAVAGARHAMGGQQFLTDGIVLDMTSLRVAQSIDGERGILDISAAADWPAVIAATQALQPRGARWGVRQKQTGADHLTLGGSVASNIHGRGLSLPPLAEDIESLTMVDARGEVVVCDRDSHPELFSLVIGGYGLFGVVVSVRLRLAPRLRLRRIVNIIDIDEAVAAAYRRAQEGCVYGDFQYAIDPSDDSFLRRGVLACYAPTEEEPGGGDADLRTEDWTELLYLAHTDKRRAFDAYARHYLSTHGRVYWSDLMQLSTYIPSYPEFLAARRSIPVGGGEADESLVIGELFVPPERVLDFLASARCVLRDTGVEDIYGTIRSVTAESTSFLSWARRDYGCVIFNLRTPHTPAGIHRTASAFRGLIDAAADLAGSYYLTYHRFATAEQMERCHPRIREFLGAKRRLDPDGVFQTDWYRHVVGLLGGGTARNRGQRGSSQACSAGLSAEQR
jgi:FAD/FMN-containing dehydrogenase